MKYCLSILLMLFAASAHAELHKWVDESGKVHYSDTAPPTDAQEQRVNIPRPRLDAASGTAAGKTIFEREADLRKELKAREEAEQKADQEQKQAAARKQNCENARNSLKSLQNSPRIATYDAEGNRSYMDDVMRQQKIDEVRKDMEAYCD